MADRGTRIMALSSSRLRRTPSSARSTLTLCLRFDCLIWNRFSTILQPTVVATFAILLLPFSIPLQTTCPTHIIPSTLPLPFAHPLPSTYPLPSTRELDAFPKAMRAHPLTFSLGPSDFNLIDRAHESDIRFFGPTSPIAHSAFLSRSSRADAVVNNQGLIIHSQARSNAYAFSNLQSWIIRLTFG